MNVLRYLIVEDNRIDELLLISMLSEYHQLQYIGTAHTIAEAEKYFKQEKPDLFFLDIEMPDGSGIDFAQKIAVEKPIIVYTTSYIQFAIESYKTAALDYLVKPILSERLKHTYKRIMDFHEMRTLAKTQLEQLENETIVFKDGFTKIKLPVKEIFYLQALQDYTKIITSHKNYLANDTLSVFLKNNEHFEFIRIHRSYAVLKRHIKILKSDKVIGGNFELPIGKTYRADIAKLKL